MLDPQQAIPELPSKIGGVKPWISAAFEPHLVSVVIPTYNRADLIGETIRSVLSQTYRPIEIVVVDDGSEDGTEAVVADIATQATQQVAVRYIHQENAGAPAARNRGTRECSGEFVQYLDSDDLLDSRKVELQVAALLADPRAGFAYGPIRELENPSRTIYCQTAMSWQRLVRKCAAVPAMQTAGPLFRRSAIAGLGPWNETIAPFEDWEYVSRAAVTGLGGVYAPGAVVYHRMQVAERLRWTGEPGTIERYVSGRVHQLESMVANACDRARGMPGFHDHIAWNLLFTGAFAVANGCPGDERRLYARAAALARGKAARLAARLSKELSRRASRRTVANTLMAGRWVYYRTLFRLVGWGA